MIVMWFFSGFIRFSKPTAILVAAGITFAARYYWWWVDGKVKTWMQLMGLDI
jgi:hypothetical protein